MNLKLNRLAAAARLTLTLGLGSVLLSGCLHDDDEMPAPNTLAADITQHGVTVYPATATATATGSGASARSRPTTPLGKW